MTRTAITRPELVAEGSDWALIVERTLPQSPDQVWTALTEPEHIQAWLPFSPDRSLTEVGPVRLTDIGMPEPKTRDGFVHQVTPREVLVLGWEEDVLRWELRTDDAGTALVLRHRFADRPQAPSYAAGWHLCLDALVDHLNGGAVDIVVGEAAMDHGYPELLQGYADALGMDVPDIPDGS